MPSAYSINPVKENTIVTTAAAVELRGLRKSYGGVAALANLDLSIEPGELIALLGPSGCGKTTALRTLAGFETTDEGKVLVDGDDITRLPANKRDMGMVFQAYSLFPNMTVLDNVSFGLRIRKANSAERTRRATELLELVGLPEHAARFPHQLSGGQQQRIALARALAIQPRVLLLDEPLSALDALVRVQLRDEIRRVQTELGITTLFVTHDQSEALSIADRVGVMYQGKLEQLAAPAELYSRPATAFVAEFVGTMNRLPGLMNGGTVTVAGRSLPVDGTAPASGSEVDVLVRPEAITLRPAEDGGGLIITTTFLGSVTRVRARLADGTEVSADLPSHQASALTAGTHVTLELDEQPVLVAAPIR
jgi:putative spermidine/putrescine transport system ATP-binding protein